MSTREKIHSLIDLLSPEDMQVMYEVLKRFAVSEEVPNEETVNAMLEADEIAHDPNVKGYQSIEELAEALEA